MNNKASNTNQFLYFSGYQVPKGTLIFRLGMLMSTDEKYFKNPDQFLPERWIRGKETDKSPVHKGKGLPLEIFG